ncbi:MAG: hypothetical protein AAF193_04760 [Bacteroidota bacterium]
MKTKKKFATAVVLSSLVLGSFLVSCGGGSEKLSPTQGVVTTIEEVSPDEFKITDEQVIATKSESKIIAKYMDGHIDTLSLSEAQLAYKDSTNTTRRHSSRPFRSVMWGGLFGYYMGRNMNSPVNRTAYGSQSAYDKSNKSHSNLKSTARRTRVSSPRRSSGRSRSSRSYGG